jgi:hypothetical protein
MDALQLQLASWSAAAAETAAAPVTDVRACRRGTSAVRHTQTFRDPCAGGSGCSCSSAFGTRSRMSARAPEGNGRTHAYAARILDHSPARGVQRARWAAWSSRRRARRATRARGTRAGGTRCGERDENSHAAPPSGAPRMGICGGATRESVLVSMERARSPRDARLGWQRVGYPCRATPQARDGATRGATYNNSLCKSTLVVHSTRWHSVRLGIRSGKQ